jgi:hypothetical protein
VLIRKHSNRSNKALFSTRGTNHCCPGRTVYALQITVLSCMTYNWTLRSFNLLYRYVFLKLLLEICVKQIPWQRYGILRIVTINYSSATHFSWYLLKFYSSLFENLM